MDAKEFWQKMRNVPRDEHFPERVAVERGRDPEQVQAVREAFGDEAADQLVAYAMEQEFGENNAQD